MDLSTVYGIYMENIWNIYGIYMEYIGNIYIWNIYGIYMEYIWNIYGIYMEYIGIYWNILEYLGIPSHGSIEKPLFTAMNEWNSS